MKRKRKRGRATHFYVQSLQWGRCRGARVCMVGGLAASLGCCWSVDASLASLQGIVQRATMLLLLVYRVGTRMPTSKMF